MTPACHTMCTSGHSRFANFERPFTRQTRLGLARDFGKTRFIESNNFGRFIFDAKIFFPAKIPDLKFKVLFFADLAIFLILAWIWKSCGEMNVKIILRVKFCSRYTSHEVSTTKFRCKYEMP